MSGRLHHPLDQTMEHDVDNPASGPHPTAPETAVQTSAEDSSEAARPWTAGLSVESAADIAARDNEEARFSHAAESWAPPGDEPAAETEPTPDWATSQFVRDNEVSPDAESPEPAAAEPVEDHVEDHGAAEAADEAVEPEASTGRPVSLAVWMDSDLRRRLRAAHTYTGDDEGFDTLSDYVAGVLERDVQRIERTYNQGVAFPGEDEAPATGEAYEVRASFGEGLWELRIEDTGVTISPTLAGAETMARTYVAVLKGIPADSVSVTVVPELDGDLCGEIARSRHDAARAEDAVRQAEEMLAAGREELGRAREDRRRITARLRDHGLSDADVDTVLAITPDA